MKRTTYNIASLEHALGTLEERYGMTSDAFYVAHVSADNKRLAEIARFDRHVWASFYREARTGHGVGTHAPAPRAVQAT
jgi:hypothetical protein